MTILEASNLIRMAVKRYAKYCDSGDTINFDNTPDEKMGELIAEAFERLQKVRRSNVLFELERFCVEHGGTLKNHKEFHYLMNQAIEENRQLQEAFVGETNVSLLR